MEETAETKPNPPAQNEQTAPTAPTAPNAQGRQNIGKKILNALLCATNDPNAPRKTWGRKCLDCLKPTSDDDHQVEGEGPARQSWNNRCTFFMSTLGMAVGLGQVWRFPTLAYSTGGGAFLIIYGVMIFTLGNALFFFEISNGQYTSKNPLQVYDKVPLFQGLGWSMIVYAYLFCTYYSHMVSFSIYYLFASFTTKLPWTDCPTKSDGSNDTYNCVAFSSIRNPHFDGIVCGEEGFIYNRTKLCSDDSYAQEQQSKCCKSAEAEGDKCNSTFNIEYLCRSREYPSEYFWNHVVNRAYRPGDPMHGYIGEFNWWMTGCSFLTWFIVYLTLYKGIKTLGALMYIMVPLPYIVLIIMFGVVIPQEGAAFGLKNFFTPEWTAFYNATVWRTATEQAFYSLGVAMGPLITFGSYSRFNSPSHIDGILICLCIFLTSVLCSLVVFSVLGFLSTKTGKPFHEAVESGPGLVFIVYPESILLLPAAPFFSVLFYLMLINLGLSSVTGIIETVPSAIYDIWPKTRKYKYLINGAVLLSCFLIGLPITCRGGLSVYNAYDTYAAGMTLIPICALELLVVIYIYGLFRFCEDIAFMIGFYPNRYYRYTWLLGPFILGAVFIYGLIILSIPNEQLYVKILGWCLFCMIVGMVPAGMIYQIIKHKKAKNLKNILKPVADHGPKNPEHREARQNFSAPKKIF